jgi:uncharacterized membrane protein
VQTIVWIAIIIFDIALTVYLTRWARRQWLSDESTPHVRVLGKYSPILTWLKYRRFPPLKRTPSPELAEGALALDGGVALPAQEPAMSSSEIPANPAASAENPAPHPVTPPFPPIVRASDRGDTGGVRVKPEARWRLALALGALGFAFIGQFFLSNMQNAFRDGFVFFAAAIVLFVILVRQAEAASPGLLMTSRVRQIVGRARSAPMQTTLVVLGVALAYTTVRFLSKKPGYGGYWDVFTLWVAGVVCYAAAFVRPMRFDVLAWAREHRREIVFVAALTGAAAVARFWQLGAVPNIISGDEGVLGTLSQSVATGKLNNMMATIYGTSTMYLFLLAGVQKLLGFTPFGLRFTSALIGTLSVPALYLLARRMFNVRVAVVATALMAVSHMHLHFSRIIVASSLQDAFYAVLALYFFYTGLEARSAPRLALSGLVMGLHLYIYMGARLMILLMPVYVLVLFLTNRKLVTDNIGPLLAYAGALIVIAAPMGWWAYTHWNEFNARANQIGVFQSGWLVREAQTTGKGQIAIFLDLIRQAFLTINYYPAQAGYRSPYPILDFVSGAVFMLGLAYSLYHIADRRHLLLQGLFWSGVIVGGALVVLPAPSGYRILIVFPAVCLFVGLAWDQLVEIASRAMSNPRVMQVAATVAFVAAIVTLNFKAYFIDYAPKCLYEDLNTRYASYLGAYAARLGPTYAPYSLSAPRVLYGIHKSVDYFTNGLPITDIVDPLTGPPTFIDPHSRAVFFFTPERESELAYVQSYMPGGAVDRLLDCGKLIMTAYVVPGE